MTRLRLAVYKGPPTELSHWLAHRAVCAATLSRYSHVELEIDGVCWSASYRDGGVRPMNIDLTSGRWDVLPIKGDADRALRWFRAHRGAPYDWAGMLRVSPLLRWLPERPHKRFCSEAVAAALGLPDPETWTPQDLVDYYVEPF